MLVEAFAKINWSLDITGVREDGYHLLDMLMQPVSLSDEIWLENASDLSVTVSGYPPVRADGTNLAYRAAALLKRETGFSGGVSIHVHKRIPAGAGMGGGSADAAAVLFGLNRLWSTGLSQKDLEEIALGLGSDIPFCLRGGLTRTRGIGELMETFEPMHNFWLVVVQPCRGLSTGEVFSAWKASPSEKHPDTDGVFRALMEGNPDLFALSSANVLQPVAESMRPEIAASCRSLKDAGAVSAVMTGSGSAVFGVFRSSSGAENAYRRISLSEKNIYLCHTQNDSIRVMD